LDFLRAVRLSPTVHNTAWPVLLSEFRVLGIVRTFRLLLGVQVIEIAEELVESVRSGKKLIAVSQMVLPELSGGVTQRLQQFGDRRIFSLETKVGARQSHFSQTSANRRLTGNKSGASCRAALLAVPVRK